VPWGANDSPISFKKSAPGSDEVLIFKSETGDNSMSKEFKFKKEGEPPAEEKKEEENKEEEKKEEGTEKSAPVKKEDESPSEEKKEEEEEEKKEEGAEKSAPSGFVKAADIESIVKSAVASAVEKAVAPLQKQLSDQSFLIRKSELEAIAKSDLAGLGNPTEMASTLYALEVSDLPAEVKKNILTTLKGAAAVKKEAGKYLFSPMGANVPAPGTAAEEFEGLVKKEMDVIAKSAGAPKDQKVRWALAATQVSKDHPELARKVQNEEKGESVMAAMGRTPGVR
jgi:hypothetical protein